MTPVTEGNKSGLITIAHNGTGATSIALSGSGVAVAQMAVASIGNAVLEAYANQATVIISVDSVAFDPTTVGSPSVAKGVLLSNSGLIDAHITSVNIVGDYALTPDSAKAGDAILANNGVALSRWYSLQPLQGIERGHSTSIPMLLPERDLLFPSLDQRLQHQ